MKKSAITFLQVTILYVVQNIDSYLLVPNFEHIKKEFGVSDSYLGFLSRSYLFATGFSSLLWAFLSDTTGFKRKILLSSSLLGASFFGFITFTSGNPVSFFVFRTLTGACLGAVFPWVTA